MKLNSRQIKRKKNFNQLCMKRKYAIYSKLIQAPRQSILTFYLRPIMTWNLRRAEVYLTHPHIMVEFLIGRGMSHRLIIYKNTRYGQTKIREGK